WLTDITEHWTDEGKLYLCAIKDAFSGRIVGYSMSDRMKARLAVNALANAATRRGDVAGCIVHSDYAEVCVKPRSSVSGVVGA
ncbi:MULTISPECIES: DDE-type integrase/transposase/recombinase, partial [unclassified Brachybacterium]